MTAPPDDDRPLWIMPKIPGIRWLGLAGVVLVALALASAMVTTIRGAPPAPAPAPNNPSEP